MALKFNIEPYWDDFNQATAVDGLTPREKYNRILFRPGHAVQARELTQIQSMLQNQIQAVGDHLFKDGSVVIPGNLHNNLKVVYLQVDSSAVTNIQDLQGLSLSDGVNSAQVLHTIAADIDTSDKTTLYIKYTDGSGVFTEGSTITGEVIDENNQLLYTASIIISSNGSTGVTTNGFPSIGYGSITSVDHGIYYIKKHFVVVQGKTIVLEKYGTPDGADNAFVEWSPTVSADIGLQVSEEIITPGEDGSLNDNAQGSPNESAPGAHRYKISAVFVTQPVNSATAGNFILLTRVQSGNILKQVRGTQYAVLEETLARRTFDESGNYTVNPFIGSFEPFDSNAETTFELNVKASKGYVRGYEVQTESDTKVTLNKAREFAYNGSQATNLTHHNWIECAYANTVDQPELGTLDIVNVVNSSGNNTGVTFRIRSMRQSDRTGYFKLDIFDVQGGGLGVGDNIKASTFESQISIVNLGNDSLVFELPYDRVKACKDTVNNAAYDYEVTYVQTFPKQATGNQDVAFVVDHPNNQYFSAYVAGTYFVTDKNGAIMDPNTYNVTLGLDGSSATISSSAFVNYETNDYVGLVAPVVSGQIHSSKTVATSSDSFAASANFSGGIELSKADIIPNSVVILDGTDDVTEYFFIDSGQRYTHYHVASIRYLPGTTYQIQGNVTVNYDYFNHAGGTFFTIDSYPAGVSYEDIPVFEGISLASAVDFRPLVIKAASGNITFSHVPTCPLHNTYFKTDIEFYLGRIDKVALKQDATFSVIEGVSAEVPQAPSSPKDAMVLYTVNVPPYTMASGDLSMDYSDNRRYTMQDIGKIDRRIKKVEYQSVLSLLEKEASDRQILGEGGTSKFKTGFLVDSFLSSNVAYGAHSDYSAAIDPRMGILRPTYSEDNANLDLTSYDGTTLLASGDVTNNGLNDGMLTLPYNEVNLISQDKYSSWTNVNPYNVFEWAGGIDLSPSSDDWKDTERRPEVVVDNDGIYASMLASLNSTNSTGTVWGNWSRVWSGISSTAVRNFAGISSGRGDAFNVDMRSSQVTTIITDTVVTEIGDRTVSVELVPFMRSRIVNFKALRMKPNTTVYPFFDGVNISSFVNSVEVNNFKPTVGINNRTQHPSGAGALITDNNGAITGSLFIPNNENLNFSTGSKVFRLTSDISNAELNGEGTAAEAIYSATGLLETVENVSISTRTPRLETSAGANQYRSSGFWYDPIAQSFMIGSYGNDLMADAATIDLPAGPGGAFITSIEIMFEMKDDNIPVQLQVREMVHGYPTMTILPGGDVTINPDQVSISEGEFTKFTFKHPIYLQDNIEYCFVLKASTDQYHARIAHIGEDDVNGNKITKQPYNGVFFKSANDSTWTPDQNIDIAFRVNRARFVSQSEVILSNSELSSRSLVRNPLSFTSTSGEILVFCRNHGLSDLETVVIDHNIESGEVHGIHIDNLKGSFVIVDGSTTRDTFKITALNTTGTTADSIATSSGIGGLNHFEISVNLRWNTLHPMIQEVTLPNTLIDFSINSQELGSTGRTGYASCLVNTDLETNGEYTINQGTTSTLDIKGIMSTTLNNLSPIIDTDRCSVATISNRINNDTTIPETDAVGGSNLAKYITKTVTLDDASDELKIYLDINRPFTTDVSVYYKLENTTDGFDQKPWIEAVGTVPFNDSGIYDEVAYSVRVGAGTDDIFSTFAIKIVMKSTRTGRIPSCRNLRAIAIID